MQGQTSRSKRARLKALFSRAFSFGQPITLGAQELPPEVEGPVSSSLPSRKVHDDSVMKMGPSLLHGAHGFVMNNPAFAVNNIQGDRDVVTQVMKALSERVIEGAEYDSSLRDPPPQCHPGTRVQLSGRINTWFHNTEREKALLWLSGPAGVGKSAVIQTFAESLADSQSLGATLFFSRLNDRKDPQRVVATVAFQLATRIPAYRTYITEQIALDPTLLKKGMKEQFRIFIIEPFGNHDIGKGEGFWGILLDGLDECEGVDEQCKIVRLVSDFVLSFPNAPFVWAISSRPEPQIVATFNHEVVALSYWSEYIPVDSTEACQDVERYLNQSFEGMRERYPYIPSNWPSETQFLKLTHGALGLFVFARTAVRFLEDPSYADPVSRLNLLLSVIDRLDVEVTDDHPFALLDALYTQVLAPIPPSVWRTTKRILGLIICTQSGDSNDGLSYSLESRTVMGASIILCLGLSVTYGSLHNLHSVLQIPDPKNAHKSQASFFHASFGDYLVDRTRSQGFYIDRGESVDDIAHSLCRLYLNKPWDTKWAQYTSQLPRILHSSFYQQLRRDTETGLYYAATGDLKYRRGGGPFKNWNDRSECLRVLDRVDFAEICEVDGFENRVIIFLIELWNRFPDLLEDGDLLERVLLRDLRVGKLDYGKIRPARVLYLHSPDYPGQIEYPDPSRSLQNFIARLQQLQMEHPEKSLAIFGRSPGRRVALVQGTLTPGEYLYFPYPY